MNPLLRSARAALLAAPVVLLPGACAAQRVEPPVPPPAFDPATARARPGDAASATAVPSDSPAARTDGAPAAPPVAPVPVPAPPASTTASSAQEGSGGSGAAPTTEKTAREKPPLGWVAGQRLDAEEVLVEWGDMAPREMFLVLDKVLTVHLVLAEADRLGIRLAPESVEARYASDREKLTQKLTGEGKAGTIEEFIEKGLGFEPARYLERMRRATIRQMLAERTVRAASLAEDSVTLRWILVKTEADAEQVRAALAEGRDFGDVAREFSVDDTADQGGLVPYLAAQEDFPLARLAFRTPVGEIAGPLPLSPDRPDPRFWLRVEERHAPVEGDWSAVEATVEASLKRYPVAQPEFIRWKLTMESRYPIDLGPFRSLIGAAR